MVEEAENVKEEAVGEEDMTEAMDMARWLHGWAPKGMVTAAAERQMQW